MIENPNPPKKQHSLKNPKILLRSQIEEAQKHTNSNQAAARWLNVSYLIYKKYAKLYDLFDRHLNVRGVGIEKGFAKRPTSIPLKDILAGKHPDYSLAKLKNRLIARGKLEEQCNLCGFSEGRITDNRVPLMLTFKDNDRTNFSLANLELRCYNCMFLTTGAPTIVNRMDHITRSFTKPETIPAATTRPITAGDYYDAADELDIEDMILTEEEKRALLEAIE